MFICNNGMYWYTHILKNTDWKNFKPLCRCLYDGEPLPSKFSCRDLFRVHKHTSHPCIVVSLDCHLPMCSLLVVGLCTQSILKLSRLQCDETFYLLSTIDLCDPCWRFDRKNNPSIGTHIQRWLVVKFRRFLELVSYCTSRNTKHQRRFESSFAYGYKSGWLTNFSPLAFVFWPHLAHFNMLPNTYRCFFAYTPHRHSLIAVFADILNASISNFPSLFFFGILVFWLVHHGQLQSLFFFFPFLVNLE